jgi:sec-independent protein translocase protein TatC
MEAELDAIEADEDTPAPEPETEPESQNTPEPDDPVTAKLHKVQELRERMDIEAARTLLYEVLEQGNEMQRRVARDILAQLDEN